uniref:G-protein coupled receptors family 3 profile domain-containing protein n=1 Tax=Oncorhynchus mykiss TaxID=8022 RepID=A0A8K9WXP4_ONCMY
MRLSPAPALDLAGSLGLLHLAVVAGGLTLLSSASASASGLESVRCKIQGTPRPPAFSQDGDFVIGGVFSIHSYILPFSQVVLTHLPSFYSLNSRELRFSRAMVFAVDEINNSSDLLPGVTLGYQVHDSCNTVPMAMNVAFHLANGLDPMFDTGEQCSGSPTVTAIVGESASSPTISMLRIIGPFGIPQVSHFSTCACLSDKKQYPTFFRTIPSDQFQAAALAHLIRHFGWTWIGAVRSDSDYGNYGMAAFLQAAQEEGICVEYSEAFSRTNPLSRVQRVADVIRSSTARVVVAFVSYRDMKILLREIDRLPSPPRQWIGTESWVTDPDMLRFSLCAGAIGFGIQRSVIPGLRDFLLDLSPQKVSNSPLLTEFWEEAFGCRLGTGIYLSVYLSVCVGIEEKVCDGSEDIQQLQAPYTDTSQLRVTNMVYKAVYAIAHAIHSIVCEERENSTVNCDKNLNVKPTQVNDKSVVSFPDKYVYIDNMYEGLGLVNWQRREGGKMEFVTVGLYDGSLPPDQRLDIEREITWVKNSTQVPVSVCSESCPPGTRKAVQTGKPVCCYDCIQCAEGQISNKSDSSDCLICPEEYWPNAERDRCILKPVEFLSFHEFLGIILTACSVGGALLAIATAAVFYRHRHSAIVRANNSELSFLLLFSLALCFLCSLTFIGRPSEWSCMLRHTAFGITFVLCISCVLGKTIVVLMAFRATLPASNVMKWFGPPQQRLTVVSFTFVQAMICTLWLVLSPPFPIKNLTTYKEKIILECDVGSAIGFWAVLGYIGLLSLLCFVLAFLARKLPDNFNEAKFITFSMLIFCAVWITFIPAYVSSPGKFTVAVEIFAIITSSFGLFFLLFVPKCFIILFRPEKNTKKHLMEKASNDIRY